MSQPEPCIFCGGDPEGVDACCDNANYDYDVEEVDRFVALMWEVPDESNQPV